uniref:Small ribosomal subunit protein bS20c n=1 Tax=Digenea simplex TaxID=945030 RepID=A0A1Z1MUX3_DIGSM|nr:ribosomal protein S20 [Digenea simplex]ARW69535.1 ribosomal protein S20 [Digenea simplex]
MPQILSNIKSYQVTLRNKYRNKKYKVAIKKAIKNYLFSLTTAMKSKDIIDFNVCSNNLSLVYKKIDKAVKKRILHKNTAGRKKAALAKMLKSIL